jgi:putative tricarboxylic transport membrane protein
VEIFGVLIGGLGQLGDPWLWTFVLFGTLVGVIGGAMPGMGTTLLYGMFLPFTFIMEPHHAVAFLLSISVGVGFGNSIPAILLGIPGTPSAVLTVIDGHTLHKQGRSGLALGTSFIAALSGQTISILFFVVLVVPLMGLAYKFLYPELFALYLLGILAIISLTGDNMLKGLLAAGFGFAIAMIGLDPVNLTTRFTFDQLTLRSGVNLTAVLIGLLAVSEIFRSFRQSFNWSAPGSADLGNQSFPNRGEVRSMVPAVMTGTVVGTFVGAIPGAGATPAALISYQAAQLISETPEKFGKGSIEGIAANEAAQNASNSGELIPTLGIGIPGSSSMVLLLSALTVQGFVPGPLMISKAPDLLYAAIAGMLAATVILAATGWFMSSLMLRAVSVNRSAVLILSLATVILGVFSLNTRILDVAVMLIAGGIGYLMLRYGYSTAAAALACVLGGEIERSLRLGLNLSNGDPLTFVSRPITATILLLTLGILIFGVLQHMKMKRRMRASADREAAEVLRSPSGVIGNRTE